MGHLSRFGEDCPFHLAGRGYHVPDHARIHRSLTLVFHDLVSTAQKCSNGVARVETQLTFANQLVSFLTLGIYSPMSIKVTCAAKRTASTDGDERIRVGVDAETLEEAIQRAAERSRAEGKPVEVEF